MEATSKKQIGVVIAVYALGALIIGGLMSAIAGLFLLDARFVSLGLIAALAGAVPFALMQSVATKF